MVHRLVGWIDWVLFLMLIAAGLATVVWRPWQLDVASAASLAGALFGGAAVLLGNGINRLNERRKALHDLSERRAKLKTIIAAELVNVAAGLFDAKKILDAHLTSAKAGKTADRIDMRLYLPREMSFTEGLGVELLLLEVPAVDVLSTLRSNLEHTRRAMNVDELSINTAMRLSYAIAHNMTVLAEAFKHIAPERKLQFEGEDAVLAIELLTTKAQPTQ